MDGLRRKRFVALSVGLTLMTTAAGFATAGTADAAPVIMATVQGESMTKLSGGTPQVRTDSKASGGKYVFLDTNAILQGRFTNKLKTTSMMVRAKTDNPATGTQMRFAIDGKFVHNWTVKSTQWTTSTITLGVNPGAHRFTVHFLNASRTNFYLDVTHWLSNRPGPRPDNPPAPPKPPTKNQGIKEKAYVTGYSIQDNSPPGSRAISSPVIHKRAAGKGTYADPITVAVGYSGSKMRFAKGTRFYVPNVRAYFIVEDKCGACWSRHPGAGYAIDLFVGSDASNKCMGKITGTHTVVRNPDKGWKVEPRKGDAGGRYYGLASNCKEFGNTPVRA